MLFIDGDFVIPVSELYPFAKAIADGTDVALNDLNHYLDLRVPLHLVTAFKYALNLACDSKDLYPISFKHLRLNAFGTAIREPTPRSFLSQAKFNAYLNAVTRCCIK